MLRLAVLALLCAVAIGCGSGSRTAAGGDASDTHDLVAADALDVVPEALADVPHQADPWAGWVAAPEPLRKMIGVASHMDQGVEPDADRDFELAKYAEIGGGRLRQNMRWNRVEPNDDDWRLDGYAKQVELASALGIPVLPQVGYDVGWAMTVEDGGDSTLDPEEYAEYTARVATEFCWWIKDYECWNEQNISRFWEPRPDPLHYGLMLKAAYPAIKAACPDARVSIGGLASWDDVDIGDRWGYLRELYAAHPDIADYFDVLALHPYTWFQFAPPEQDQVIGVSFEAESQSRMTAIAREILAELGKPDAPIFYTEVGWPSYDLSEDDVARFAVRSVLLAARDGVEAWYWYTFFDDDPSSEAFRPHENHFGLFGWPGDAQEPRREKPAWRALKALAAAIGGARYARDLSADLGAPNDVYVLGFVDDGGKRFLAAWDGREQPDNVAGQASVANPDTTWELKLPLPEGSTGVRVVDLVGTELPAPAVSAQGSVTLTLDRSVRYLAIE